MSSLFLLSVLVRKLTNELVANLESLFWCACAVFGGCASSFAYGCLDRIVVSCVFASFVPKTRTSPHRLCCLGGFRSPPPLSFLKMMILVSISNEEDWNFESRGNPWSETQQIPPRNSRFRRRKNHHWKNNISGGSGGVCGVFGGGPFAFVFSDGPCDGGPFSFDSAFDDPWIPLRTMTTMPIPMVHHWFRESWNPQ